MSEKLKPCPFCGSDRLQAYDERGFLLNFVVCDSCDADGPSISDSSEENCVEMWNTRASDAEIERLKARLAKKEKDWEALKEFVTQLMMDNAGHQATMTERDCFDTVQNKMAEIEGE